MLRLPGLVYRAGLYAELVAFRVLHDRVMIMPFRYGRAESL